MRNERRITMTSLRLALLALLLAPAAAQAQKVKVVVVPYAPLYESIPRATGERIAEILEESLGANNDIELVHLEREATNDSAASAMATPEQAAAVAAAKEELERGKGLLKRRRVKPALDAFTKAIETMESNATALEDIDPLVEAYLKQAVALFLMGGEDRAAEGPLPKAIKLQPTKRLEAGEEYAKVFVDLMEKVRGSLAAEGQGSLRVDTTPPGAGVWVDDRDAMTSPVLVTGLIPGTHFVRIKLPSTDAYVTKVVITKDETFHISPDDGAAQTGAIASLLGRLSQNELDAEGVEQVKAIAKETGAQVVVIGGAYAKGANVGIVSYAYHVAQGAVDPLHTVTLDRDMLGATIEINKVASQLGQSLSAPAEPASLPRPLAADAQRGAEKIHEVDFSVSLVPVVSEEKDKGGAVVPAGGGSRRPIGGKRAPVGGGGPVTPAEPETAEAPPAPVEEDFVDAPKEPTLALDFFSDGEDFGQPAPSEDEGTQTYKYAGGVSIKDETVFEEPKKEGGLLTKWWFWTAAGVVAGGAVGIAALSSGGGGGATGSASW